MRIKSKLTAVVLSVFLIVGTVAALALDRLHEMAQLSVELEGRNLATSMATMAGYEIANDRIESRHAQFQRIIDFVAAREKRDLAIVDANLIIVADVVAADIGTPVEAARSPTSKMWCGAPCSRAAWPRVTSSWN